MKAVKNVNLLILAVLLAGTYLTQIQDLLFLMVVLLALLINNKLTISFNMPGEGIYLIMLFWGLAIGLDNLLGGKYTIYEIFKHTYYYLVLFLYWHIGEQLIRSRKVQRITFLKTVLAAATIISLVDIITCVGDIAKSSWFDINSFRNLVGAGNIISVIGVYLCLVYKKEIGLSKGKTNLILMICVISSVIHFSRMMLLYTGIFVLISGVRLINLRWLKYAVVGILCIGAVWCIFPDLTQLYYTVLCDFLPDNLGQYAADKFYLVSTTDKDAVLKVAVDEKIDGVLAYASDPAAPTAAYVAEKLGLPTNPYQSVETLCNKDRFRAFLKENGFCTPTAVGYAEKNVDTSVFNLPVIIKPVDSSGSKGATVLHSWDGLDKALDFAFSFSRSHRIIVEEFIEKKHEYLIGGDIFVADGKVILWGLLNCHRDNNVNPLVPVGKSYPLMLEDSDIKSVEDTLQKMVDDLGLRFGSVNVELVVDKNNRVWPIDVGPRAGGNMIPDLLGMIFDVDVVEMAVLAAMGVQLNCKMGVGTPFYATHNLHTSKDGIYKGIEFSEELEKRIIKKCLYKKYGDKVEFFDNAAKALGIIFMKFDNQEEMSSILENINEFYNVVVE